MKTVTLIRHSRLGDPYSDYTKLSFDQYRDLGLCRVDPDIDPDSLQLISEKFIREQLQDIDLILCSPLKRAWQTSELIKSLGEKELEINESGTLREISFDLALLITEESFVQYGSSEVRRALFSRMLNKEHGVEPLADLFKRIHLLEKMLAQSRHENILCITHGFYLRVLQLYFLERLTACQAITIDKLMMANNYDYLEGFTFTLEKDALHFDLTREAAVV